MLHSIQILKEKNMACIDLTKETFNETLDNNEIVIVDFWAPWCGPCVTMAPHFETAALSIPLQAQFLKINNDDAQMQNSNIIIVNIPAVLVFKDGKEIDRFTGARSSKQIIKWVQQYL